MGIMEETTKEIVASAAKVAPPVSATGAHLLGFSLPDWVMFLTVIYTSIQIFLLLRDRVFRKQTRSES